MPSAILKIVKAYGTLLGFGILLLFFWVMLPQTFMSPRNLINITQQMSMLAVTACGMTVVMAQGDFDLSVGAMASLSGIVAAVVFQFTGSVLSGVAAALAVGLAGGALNGFLASYLGILPFVATLGTLTIFSGTAFLVSGGKTIFGSAIPADFSNIAKSGIPLGWSGAQVVQLPTLTIIAIAVVLLTGFILRRMVFGRHVYAIGGNAEAARLSGINVKKTRLIAFCVTNVGAALAGLMLASRVASANPTQGSGLMLDAIAAVFLGMTMSRHGEPRVMYSLIGVLVIGVLSNGLTQLSIDSYIRDILVGTKAPCHEWHCR